MFIYIYINKNTNKIGLYATGPDYKHILKNCFKCSKTSQRTAISLQWQ